MIEKILKNKKLRVTPFRKEVLEIFVNTPNAIAMADIGFDNEWVMFFPMIKTVVLIANSSHATLLLSIQSYPIDP